MAALNDPRPCQRVYGSYKWRCSLPTCNSQDHKLSSSEFTVGSFSWFLRTGIVKDSNYLFLYLQCHHPPAVPVTAQLWLANQDNPDASQAHTLQYTPVKGQGRGYSSFLPWSTILDDTAGFAKNSIAIFGAHLSFNETKAITKQSVEDGKHYFSTMHLSKFRSLYNDAAFSDVVVRAAGPGVKAHKAILAVSSPTFKTMFESGMQEEASGVVNFAPEETPVMEALLSFMYGALTGVSDELLLPLFKMADQYQVLELRAACLEHLLVNVAASNIVEYMISADACNEKGLLHACCAYAKSNSGEVAQAPSMQRLMQDSPQLAQQLMIAIANPKKRKHDESK